VVRCLLVEGIAVSNPQVSCPDAPQGRTPRILMHCGLQEEDQLPLGTCIRDVLLGPSPASAAAAARPSGLIPAPGLEWASRQAGEGAPVVRGMQCGMVAQQG